MGESPVGSVASAAGAAMMNNTNNNTQSIADYLAQLLKDKKQLAAFPNVFVHLERLLDDGKPLYDFVTRPPTSLGAQLAGFICESRTFLQRIRDCFSVFPWSFLTVNTKKAVWVSLLLSHRMGRLVLA